MSDELKSAMESFYAHLDLCEQCRENPFALCSTGTTLLLEFARLHKSAGVLVAQNDDPELLEWLANADQRGGGFVSRVAGAALRADHENYPLIRPLVLQLRAKYTEYEPSDLVKQEIRDRVKP